LAKVIKNPGKAEKIGNNARKKSEEIEDFDGYVSRMIEIYINTLKS